MPALTMLQDPPTRAPVTAARLIDLSGSVFIIRFNYNPALVERVKKLPGRRWNPRQKHWTAPVAASPHVAAFAARNDFMATNAANSLLSRFNRPPAIELRGNQIIITTAFNVNLVHSIKRLPGAKWDKKQQVWAVPLDDTAALGVERFAHENNITLKPDAREAFARVTAAGKKLRELSLAADGVDISIPGLRGELMPFQKAGVKYALTTKRCFIADEMGLGKTVQALACIHAINAYPSVIVCPASLKTNWAREARKWLPPEKVIQQISGSKPAGSSLLWTDIWVINYDILKHHVERLAALGIQAVVFDEFHYCKNNKAQRSKAAKLLAKDLEYIWGLTGTPILNRPRELAPQLSIMRRLVDLGGYSSFMRRYDEDDKPEVQTELNDRLRGVCYVRRKKEDVLKDLPAKRRAENFIAPDPRIMPEYRRAEADVIEFLGARARELAQSQGQDGMQAEWQARMRAEAAEHLVKIGQLKKLAAKAKMKSATEWIDEFIQSGEKLVVFAHHREIVDQLSKQYGGCRIAGGDTAEGRQAAVDAFQNDPETQVIVCSIRAAGVGLTLTAASNVLFLELDWTPAAHDQAEDRCHRIGQSDSVTAWYLLCEGTIEETIYQLIQEKRAICSAVADGEIIAGAGQSIASELLISMAERANE